MRQTAPCKDSTGLRIEQYLPPNPSARGFSPDPPKSEMDEKKAPKLKKTGASPWIPFRSRQGNAMARKERSRPHGSDDDRWRPRPSPPPIDRAMDAQAATISRPRKRGDGVKIPLGAIRFCAIRCFSAPFPSFFIDALLSRARRERAPTIESISKSVNGRRKPSPGNPRSFGWTMAQDPPRPPPLPRRSLAHRAWQRSDRR